MQAELRANEFHIFTSVHAELRGAMRRQDRRTAYLAIEELRGIQQHSEWPALRARCAAALSEYSLH